MGAKLARRLAPFAAAAAMPLVGTGAAYGDVPLLGPRASLPSGGFGVRGRGWLADLRAGIIRAVREQRRTMRARAHTVRHVVAVGDVYCLWMAAAAGAPVTLVATAKSSRHDPYSRLEVRVLRTLAARVYARDDDTAAALRQRGVNADYVGNPLMDTIGAASSRSWRSPDDHVVVLLPGSRAEAHDNLHALLRLAQAAAGRARVRWLCALAPTVDAHAVRTSLIEAGWTVAGSAVSRGEARVELTSDFAGAVRDADAVVSLAGTASEQAAGLGKPIVAFPGNGPQFTAKFLAAQQRLLGDALVATTGWMDGAAAVLGLLGDPEQRLRRGAAGRLRMGPPGALARIAQAVTEALGA